MSTGQEEARDELNLPSTRKANRRENRLYLNPKLSDVTFVVGGEKLHAHKAILAAKSEHFERLFDENCDKKEITLSNTSPEIVRLFLKCIYTDIISIPSDNEQILQLLLLAQQYSFEYLESGIIEKIKDILDANNVIYFVNQATNHDLDDLRDICHSFIDANAFQILTSESFNDLTQKSLFQMLKRDHRLAPEIDIFKSVARWCERNKSNSNVILECVRLPLLTQFEILFIVWPTKLVNAEKLLEAVSETVLTNPKNVDVGLDENIATVQYGAKVISHRDSDILLTGNTDVARYVKHTIEEKSGITVRLHRPCWFNHIRMKLYDADKRDCSYYIETSVDQKSWSRIVDHSSYPCRSVQNLYFDLQISQYIKVVGTSTTVGNDFRLVFFEAFYKSKIPRTQNGITCPEANVATPENGAIVIEGKNPQDLLNGNRNYYCSHEINSGQSGGIIVQLSQPYVISSMRFLLWDHNKYEYVIETSVNKRDWQIAIDRRGGELLFKGWQDLQFAERVVVYVKLTGTFGSSDNRFILFDFECPKGKI